MADKGEVIIKMPKLSRVQQAFGLYWGWLHEVRYELDENAHPSWKGFTEKQFQSIRELKNQMTDEEKAEFDKKISPFKI